MPVNEKGWDNKHDRPICLRLCGPQDSWLVFHSGIVSPCTYIEDVFYREKTFNKHSVLLSYLSA